MPNPIKYSVSAQSKALKRGNFFIGTGDDPKGDTPISDYWNGITPPVGGYTIYLNKASQGPSIYVAANDSELISLTNRIASTSYTTVGECLSWFSTQTDKMVLNKDYEPIVTDGLAFSLDAGFVSSYPKSGTTWYDISGSNNVTLVNGSTFNSSNGGSIMFDGVDDMATGSTNISYTNTQTWMAWIKRTSSGNVFNMFMGRFLPYFSFRSTGLFHFSNQVGGTQVNLYSPLTYLDNVWYFTCFTTEYNNPNTTMKMYINGSLVSSGSFPGTQNNLSYTYTVGDGRNTSTWYPFNGYVSMVSVYDRTLSASEILQNYYKGPIVTSGLVFAVDAGNIVSYEPGSITAYDLTGNVTSGTLNNGTYGSGNWFIFDGSNDEISFPHDADYKNQSLSVDFWVNLDSESSGRHVMFTTWYGFTVEVNNPGGSLSWGLNGLPGQYMTAGTITYGSTTHIACTYNTTTNVQNIYINGSLAGTQIVDGTINYSSDNLYFSGSWDRTKGKMGSMKIYNKELSSSEVKQNYQAQSSRFGL
jgi:hypothetical protein